MWHFFIPVGNLADIGCFFEDNNCKYVISMFGKFYKPEETSDVLFYKPKIIPTAWALPAKGLILHPKN